MAGRGNSKCKGPVVGVNSMYGRDKKKSPTQYLLHSESLHMEVFL